MVGDVSMNTSLVILRAAFGFTDGILYSTFPYEPFRWRKSIFY